MKKLFALITLLFISVTVWGSYPVSKGGGGIPEWQPATIYQVDNLVWEAEKFYKALNGHTSAATFPPDLAIPNWIEMSDDLNREADSSVTADAVMRWDGTTGDDAKDSLAILNDAGALSGLTQLNSDNIQLDGNTISTINSGNLVLDSFDGDINVPDLTVSQNVQVDASGNLVSQDIDLVGDVTGILPIVNGGTATNQVLNNNFVMVSLSSAIRESSTITTTELGYLDGLTEPISTSLAAKADQDLNNLTNPVAFNQNLIPAGAGFDVGSSGVPLSNVYTNTVDSGSGPLTIEVAGVPKWNFAAAFNSSNVPLAMNANQITGVADPTLDQDAATKKYVDDNENPFDQDLNTTDAVQFLSVDLAGKMLVDYDTGFGNKKIRLTTDDEVSTDSASVTIETGTATTSGESGKINLLTGNVVSGINDSGDINIVTGSNTGTGASGNIILREGSPSAAPVAGQVWTAKDVLGAGEWAALPAPAGANLFLSNLSSPTAINQDLLSAGTETIGESADPWATGYFNNIVIENGLDIAPALSLGTFGAIPSGENLFGLKIRGKAQSAIDAQADMTIYTSDRTGAQSTGDLYIETGNSDTGNSGDITLYSGQSTSGTDGDIILKDGSEGTSGHVWTSTGTSGEGSWAAISGNFANQTLNNLTSPTAVNQDLIPSNDTKSLGADGTALEPWLNIYVKNVLSTGNSPLAISTFDNTVAASGAINLETGTSDINTGAVNISSGASSTSGTGNVNINTGISTTGNSGQVRIDSGDLTGNNSISGAVIIASGNSTGTNNSHSGSATFSSGDTGLTGQSGDVTMESGSAGGASTGNTGTVKVSSGFSGGSGFTGALNLTTGNNTSAGGGNTGTVSVASGTSTNGNSGGVQLTAGLANNGTRGLILLSADARDSRLAVQPADNSVPLAIATTQFVIDNGGGAGANTTLSNLTSPTAVNQNLVPFSVNNFDTGSISIPWRTVYTEDIQIPDGSGNLIGRLHNNSGSSIILASNNSGTAQTKTLQVLTGNQTGTNGTGQLTLKSGNSTAANSGAVIVESGTGGTTSGLVNLKSGNSSTISGIVTVATGNSSTSSSGNLDIVTGTAATSTGGITVRTTNANATSGSSGAMTLGTGHQLNAGSSTNTGDVTFKTGDHVGTGNSGVINIETGVAVSSTSGAVSLKSGAGGSPSTGAVTVGSGVATTGSSGTVIVSSGTGTSPSSGNSGNVSLLSGQLTHAANTSTTGTAVFGSADNLSTSTGASGSVILESGSVSGSGATGSVTIQSGTTSGTRGEILLKDGSTPAAGYVWTSKGTSGAGEWAAGGAGANTALSNLIATSIPESLVPNAVVSKDLGSTVSTSQWANLYLKTGMRILSGGGAVTEFGIDLNGAGSSGRIFSLSNNPIEIQPAGGQELLIDADADKFVMDTQPTGTVDLAVATTGYVNDRFSKTAAYHQGAGQSYDNSGGGHIVNFDVVDFDPDSLVTTGAAWKYTAANTGVYRIQASIGLLSVADNVTFAMYLFKNGGANSQISQQRTSGTANPMVEGSIVVSLAATDFIDIRFTHTDTVNRTSSGSLNKTRVSITQIE